MNCFIELNYLNIVGSLAIHSLAQDTALKDNRGEFHISMMLLLLKSGEPSRSRSDLAIRRFFCVMLMARLVLFKIHSFITISNHDQFQECYVRKCVMGLTVKLFSSFVGLTYICEM